LFFFQLSVKILIQYKQEMPHAAFGIRVLKSKAFFRWQVLVTEQCLSLVTWKLKLWSANVDFLDTVYLFIAKLH
jgi:hypothetical protein